MNRYLWMAAVACLTIAAAGLNAKDGRDDDGGRRDDGRRERNLLEWDTMAGVPRPYTGATNAIRGVAGGGLPWTIASGRGELSVDGHLEVKVSGLVFDGNDSGVQAANLANQNTVPNFRAVVSCRSKDGSGNATTVNITTDLFPATLGFATAGGGNAHIEAHVQLPNPCLAPIVFVTSPGGAWFAATGM